MSGFILSLSLLPPPLNPLAPTPKTLTLACLSGLLPCIPASPVWPQSQEVAQLVDKHHGNGEGGCGSGGQWGWGSGASLLVVCRVAELACRGGLGWEDERMLACGVIRISPAAVWTLTRKQHWFETSASCNRTTTTFIAGWVAVFIDIVSTEELSISVWVLRRHPICGSSSDAQAWRVRAVDAVAPGQEILICKQQSQLVVLRTNSHSVCQSQTYTYFFFYLIKFPTLQWWRS